MSFPSKSGCPFCGIVSRAASAPSSASPLSSASLPDSPAFNASSPSPSFSPPRAATRSGRGRGRGSTVDEPDILWHDDNFTVYRERAHPVSSIAHLVIIFNLHVPSLYMLSSSDVPLLVHLRDTAHRLLADLTSASSSPDARSSLTSPPTTPSPSPSPLSSATRQTTKAQAHQDQFRVGFITPPWKDTQIPIKDHLHLHAYVAPMDRCGWWRAVAYSPLAWYAVDDLIAEIREETTNNRIRADSSDVRRNRPIDRIPGAGARSGTSDGHETTREGIAADLEAGHHPPHTSDSTSRYGRSPLAAPSPARLAAPSHLDLNAMLVGRSLPDTPTRGAFAPASGGSGNGMGRASSPAVLEMETHPGSSLGPGGQLLSPAFPTSS